MMISARQEIKNLQALLPQCSDGPFDCMTPPGYRRVNVEQAIAEAKNKLAVLAMAKTSSWEDEILVKVQAAEEMRDLMWQRSRVGAFTERHYFLNQHQDGCRTVARLNDPLYYLKKAREAAALGRGNTCVELCQNAVTAAHKAGLKTDGLNDVIVTIVQSIWT
jgi:hypothetical protein